MVCAAAAVQAQQNKYDYSVVPPTDMQMPTNEFKGIGEAAGTSTLSDGQQLSWRVGYSTSSYTFYNWQFAKPADMSQAVFENSINAMTSSAFWKGANLCTYQSPENIAPCIQSVLNKAASECQLPNGLPCWTDKK